MNYFDSDMSNSTNTVVCFDGKDGILYLRLRTMSHTIYAACKQTSDLSVGKISLAHARHTHKPGDKITK
jgi:hypothetical protein